MSLTKQFSDEEIAYFPNHSFGDGTGNDTVLEESINQKFAAFKGDKRLLARMLKREALSKELAAAGVDASDEAIDQALADQFDDNTGGRSVPILDRPSYSSPVSLGPLVPGLIVFYGLGKTGKSKEAALLHELCVKQGIDSAYLIAGEPDHRSVHGWDVVRNAIVNGFVDDDKPEVLVVDSIKDALYAKGESGGGGLLSGGVQTSFILDISEVSSHLMAEGRTVIAVVNPSQEKYEDELYELIKSNATGIFHFRGETVVASSFRRWNQDGYYDRIEGNGNTNSLFLAAPENKQGQVTQDTLKVSNPVRVRGVMKRLIHETNI